MNDGKRIEVAAGEPVTFEAKLKVPPQQGYVTSFDWNFGSTSTAFEPATVLDKPVPVLNLTRTASFSTPGTYFVTLRVKAQRNGVCESNVPSDNANVAPGASGTVATTTVWNLDRVRVVVH